MVNAKTKSIYNGALLAEALKAKEESVNVVGVKSGTSSTTVKKATQSEPNILLANLAAVASYLGYDTRITFETREEAEEK